MKYYNVEDFIKNKDVRNLSLYINGSHVELIMSIKPELRDVEPIDVPYWKVYMRPEDKHIADNNLDEAMTLQELIDYLMHCRKPHSLNAYPRKSKSTRISYYCEVLEDFVEVWKKNTEQLVLIFDKQGKLQFSDGSIKQPYSHKRKYFYRNYNKEWKLHPFYDKK